MLLSLLIENVALIRRAVLEPAPGLNAITGETGAGKTLLAQAIGLLTGAPPSPDLIGPHGDEAYVEAEFAVPPALLEREPLAGLRPEGETTLVVARRLTRAGRSRALLWGRACARADLEAVADGLLEISSQHEARRLARPAYALDLLDGQVAIAGAPLAAMADAHRSLVAARDALERARREAADTAARRDELEALCERVESLAPAPGEREALQAERERLRHADELAAAATGAAELLSPEDGEGALGMTAAAESLLAAVERIEPRLGAVGAELREAHVRLQEAAGDLRSYAADLEFEPGRLEVVEERLHRIAELERRYGADIDALVERAAAARQALDAAESTADRLAALEGAAEAAEAAARAAADRVRAARVEAADPFARAVERHLADLGMDDARFEVRLAEAPLGPRGADRVELHLAANPGLPAAPVARVASGGELSRIALAIRVAAREGAGAAGERPAGALLLDEIDAGIGGRTAVAVGEKLAQLADGAQLLCITHLPQIASRAEAHFRVEKRVEKGSAAAAAAEIVRLGDEEAVTELARMLGGAHDDETARRHARALRGEEARPAA